MPARIIRLLSALLLLAVIAASGFWQPAAPPPAAAASAATPPARLPTQSLFQTFAPADLNSDHGLPQEAEPNNSVATAMPLPATPTVIEGNLLPNDTTDMYSFAATAGDRVYAATITANGLGASVDTTLAVRASDGTTVLESDNDDGSLSSLSSSIAGLAIPSDGTYYLRVTRGANTVYPCPPAATSPGRLRSPATLMPTPLPSPQARRSSSASTWTPSAMA
jgi:hypothetical protein